MRPYYGLRDYRDGDGSLAGQIGSEATPAEYIAALTACTREWVRVLKPSGSMFVNLGDKFAGVGGPNNGGTLTNAERHQAEARRIGPVYSKGVRSGAPPKSLMGLPWRYALACTDELGLILRRDVIWSKPNGLPESVTDRCRSSHEYVFHLVKRPRYYAAVDEIREPHEHQRRDTWDRRTLPAMLGGNVDARMGNNPLGKLPGSVWEIPSQPLTVPPGLGIDHFAAFPMELPRRIIAGWSPPGICTACGEGRRPVVDKALVGVWHDKPLQNSRYHGTGGQHQNRRMGQERAFGSTEATITGYACACPQPDAPTRPAIVADPFGCTGTTAIVAGALGRTGLSFDRSAAYCRLARWRAADPGQRALAHQVPKPPPVMDGQDALFAVPT